MASTHVSHLDVAYGSIHEGGELGYVLSHAFGAVFDNPDLLAVAVIGDGEAETAPLEGAWKSIKFLNPARDGAVLPILHLNGSALSMRSFTADPATSVSMSGAILKREARQLHSTWWCAMG